MNEPLTEWEALGQAVEECKRAFLEALTPIFIPMLEFLERILRSLRSKTE